MKPSLFKLACVATVFLATTGAHGATRNYACPSEFSQKSQVIGANNATYTFNEVTFSLNNFIVTGDKTVRPKISNAYEVDRIPVRNQATGAYSSTTTGTSSFDVMQTNGVNVLFWSRGVRKAGQPPATSFLHGVYKSSNERAAAMTFSFGSALNEAFSEEAQQLLKVALPPNPTAFPVTAVITAPRDRLYIYKYTEDGQTVGGVDTVKPHCIGIEIATE